MELSQPQQSIVNKVGKFYLTGVAGTGKTTAAIERIRRLLVDGIAGETVLVMVPQRTLAIPYDALLPELSGSQINILTLGGITRQAVDIFWPIIAPEQGFHRPELRPTYLSLETAQYFMARVVGPVIEREGLFDSVTIDRNRLFSQLIDNMNKASVVGFPYTEIGDRLKDSLHNADDVQRKVYDDVQTCVEIFRDYCLQHNLLDFSLQVQLFRQHIWQMPQYERILSQYRHIIIDNIEEDTPTSHEIMRMLVSQADTALVIEDSEAGYRRFLGADPAHARTLQPLCDEAFTFKESYVINDYLAAFSDELALSLDRHLPENETKTDPRKRLLYGNYKYHPQMIDGVAELITSLVHNDGVDPSEIVVLSPYLSDALRFSLMNRLEAADVPVRSHRPSRSLREEPAAVALLTLAQLAHPHWRMFPTAFDIIYALMESIDGLDLVRAQLLARDALQTVDGQPQLLPFEGIRQHIQERVTYLIGERYDRLRDWLQSYIQRHDPNTDDVEHIALDHFFSRLFGEVLSQPGMGFHDDFDAAEVAANLVDSARRFRWIITESQTENPEKSIAQEYVEMVGQGVIADQYLRNWEVQAEDAVLLAPAYTFLMSNRPVDYQFWLNVGGRGWAERLYQPLTNPYVLSLQWEHGRKWRDEDEREVTQEALYRLVTGLIRRCRQQIYLGFSELGEQGYEQRGELLGAVQRMLKRLAQEDQHDG